MSDQVITFTSGVTSSSVPRYDLIPTGALNALAERFEIGLRNHSGENWRTGLRDKGYIINRLNHIQEHLRAAIDKLTGVRPDDGDNDAAAIMWGGAILCEYLARERTDVTFPSGKT